MYQRDHLLQPQDVDTLSKSLKKYGYDAAPIHGDLDQSQRTKTLDGFRAGDLRFLVASDVAARGLDVPAVSHVFNFDVPSHAEDYVHRIGRTGRAGRDGKAIMICAPRDEKNLEDVERLVQREIPRLENPLGGGAAPTSESAAKPADDSEKPKRSRSRSRKSDEKPKDQKPATEAPATTEAAKPAPEAKPATQEKPRQKHDTPRKENPRSNNNRSRNNDNRDGNKVVGLGDHLPDFIGLSFEEREN